MVTSPLVSTAWLADHLADPSLLILDICSAESGGRVGFEAGHIPGAVHSDYATDGWRITEGGAGGLLPDAAHLSTLLSRLGMAPEHHVVIVPAGEAASDFSAAARVYWTLKAVGHGLVSILDGGFKAWREAGRLEEAGVSMQRASQPYPVR